MYNMNALGGLGSAGTYSAFGGYRGYAADNQKKLYNALEARLGADEARRYTGVSKEEASSSTSGTAGDARSFVQNYTKKMTELRGAANELLNDGSEAPSASSSNNGILEGAVTWRSASAATYEIQVSQLAAAQVNTSAGVQADGANTLSSGDFQLRTDKGEVLFDMSDYAGYKTNREAMSALAKDINRQGLGLTASTAEKDGKISLTIRSNSTGEANAFQAEGSFAVSNGLSEASQSAQDAVYSVNGKTQSSGSNRIQLDTYKVDVTLKAEGSAKLTVGADPNKTVQKTKKLVESYNSALSFLNDNYAKGRGVLQQMSNMLHLPVSEDSLKSVGITVGKDGTMSLDENQLRKSLSESPETTREVLRGSYSLAQGLAKDAAQGMSIPSSKLTDGMRASVSDERAAIQQQFGGYTYGRSSYATLLNYRSMGALLNTLV